MRIALLLLAAPALLSPLSAQTPKGAAASWDKIYLGADSRVPVNPSALVLESTASLTPGVALDIGMGNGRNAIYLARKGWKVTGIDVSGEAVRQASASASKLGAQIDARVANFETFAAGRAQYDLILGLYIQGLAVRQAHKIIDALKPGGYLVIEGHHADVRTLDHKGQAPPQGYQTNELLRAFSRLRILRYEDRVAQAEWYNGPDGKSPVVRLVARKD
jgi:SAM-dependent methyltransferase